MQKSPIWESATRPLFVRSVWLESDGGHRHFLLDYQPQQKRINDIHVKPKKDNFRQTQSYEYPEYEFSDDDNDNLLLVGLQKEQFQPFHQTKVPVKQLINTPKRSINTKSLLDIIRRRPDSGFYNEYTYNGNCIDMFKNEPPSKMSSLQDINSNISNSDERLAERVLNWLDLAGKNTLTQNSNVFERIVKKSSARISENNIRKNKLQPQTSSNRNYKANSTEKRPDSVKHITIVFNKEGIPIRYNRPVRYSDLFRSGYSGPKKYGIGSFSANNFTRLGPVESVGINTSAFDKTALDLKKPQVRTTSIRKNYDHEFKVNGNNRKDHSCSNLRDVKKQLHIFMPNLPKKYNLTVVDDMASNISASISELKANEVACNL